MATHSSPLNMKDMFATSVEETLAKFEALVQQTEVDLPKPIPFFIPHEDNPDITLAEQIENALDEDDSAALEASFAYQGKQVVRATLEDLSFAHITKFIGAITTLMETSPHYRPYLLTWLQLLRIRAADISSLRPHQELKRLAAVLCRFQMCPEITRLKGTLDLVLETQ
eukprot:gnl/Dysnectes_brevis/1525_a1730_2920.p1 GENE.gnl/Dysnectes_brevis/1525_a1730_2920~~gnl/Dysnectes_brevis/1525_a1730_2920.p1  ORF type:complete len:177 (-),score=34.19 gnl/Dysnectes_brevis/1525_a1730_2920:41-547(-)